MENQQNDTLTLEDFMNMDHEVQMEFKNRFPDAYLNLFGRSGTKMEYVDANRIKSLEEFMALPIAKQIYFRDKHPEDYKALF